MLCNGITPQRSFVYQNDGGLLYKYIVQLHKYIVRLHKYIVRLHKYIVQLHKYIVQLHNHIMELINSYLFGFHFKQLVSFMKTTKYLFVLHSSTTKTLCHCSQAAVETILLDKID